MPLTGSYSGIGTAPTLVSAQPLSSTLVRIIFSEAMDSTVLIPGNYTITEDLGSDPRVVSYVSTINTTTYLLTLDGNLTEGVDNYNVQVSSVYDLVGNLIDVANDDIDFSGPAVPIPGTIPYLRTLSPSADSDKVSVYTPLSIEILDDADIDLTATSIQLRFGDGTPFYIYRNGTFEPGINTGESATTAITGSSGYRFDFVLSKALPYNTLITVIIDAVDTGSNTLSTSYWFITEIAPVKYSYNLDMYNFLIEPIRNADIKEGNLLVKRYLEGPQRAWDTIVDRINALPNLWSVTDIEDAYLPYLKNIVGWTKELDYITDRLDSLALRRLIAASGLIWKKKGPEDTLIDVLRIATGARARIWNWFDFRWVIDETGLGEEHEGTDPWIIDLPSTETENFVDSGILSSSTDGRTITIPSGVFSTSIKPGDIFILTGGIYGGEEGTVQKRVSSSEIILHYPGIGAGISWVGASWKIVSRELVADDPYRMNLRIVDNGLIDKQLVVDLVRLLRPANERVDITYLDFLDRFNVPDDNVQWNPLNTGNITVAEGRLALLDDSVAEKTFAIVENSSSWTEYATSVKIKGESLASGAEWGALFYYVDDDNHYKLLIDTYDQTLRVVRVTSGGETELDLRADEVGLQTSLDLGALEIGIYPNIYYTFRIQVVREGGNNRVQIFLDGSELVNAIDTTSLTAGSIGVLHEADAVVECAEIEMFQIPSDTYSVEINS